MARADGATREWKETALEGLSRVMADCAHQWRLSFLMLVGRLELLTVYVLVTPAFWRA